ncbi:concanavalin A-like lectin/glucanase [Tricholoma matsutake]|nr:concanavalin A-like lectin/glucanase [Tricholoma matsutake 945]
MPDIVQDDLDVESKSFRPYRRRFSIGDVASDSSGTRPPPSAFSFPFQAYPGNPDPGMSIPGLGPRRNPSLESMTAAVQRSYAALGVLDQNNTLPRSGSLSDLHRPYAPFMADSTPSPSNSVYRNSAAANMMPPDLSGIPRISSSPTVFRAPFLSPASRPNSSLWSPPSSSNLLNTASPNASTTALPISIPKSKPPLPSTRLAAPLSQSEKPWLNQPDTRARAAWWVTLACWFAGLAGAALLCWSGVRDVKSRMLNPNNLCLVMDENWSTGLDPTRWSRDVQLGGFGNGEFEMTTTSDTNLYFSNGQLYILPTLSSLAIQGNIMQNGANYTLPGCTATQPAAPPATSANTTTNSTTTTRGGTRPTATTSSNGTVAATQLAFVNLESRASGPTTLNTSACTATTSDSLGTVINPVMSARINTKGKVGIRYGRVEIKAKLPRGDWLWPAVWMLPENDTYGKWPLSGEIDILEARGNAFSYPAQGSNYVRSSLNYGLSSQLTPISTSNQGTSLSRQIYGWFSMKRTSFDQGFHTYAIEWDASFMRFYVDSRVRTILEVDIQGKNGKGFWDRGGFPGTAQNGSSAAVVLTNPWAAGGPSAPFDQRFYLIINLAVGGTSGWFPDNKGNKPWYDGSLTAMRDFARAQDKWYPTWPSNADDRAFRLQSVKMWSMEPVC